MYANILNDKKIKITEKQKVYLRELKERNDREKEEFSQIQKNADGVLPTYREALRQVERTKASEKTPYQMKEDSLQRLQEKFTKIDKKSHSNSKEYTEMLKSAKQLQTVLEAVSDPEKWKTIGIENTPNEHEINILLKKTEDAARKAVNTYIKEKGNPFTEFGKNRLATAKELKAELEKSIHLFHEKSMQLSQEESMDKLMKEQAHLKADLSKIKPPFSTEELKTLRDKFEPGSSMHDAGNKAMAALDMLGGMKYQMDQSGIKPDQNRMKDNILKVMAFTILGGREITDPEKQNVFSTKYYNEILEGLKNAKAFEGRSQEEWFAILEKKEGAPTLKEVCAEFKEGRLAFQKEIEKQEQLNKKIDDCVKNQYMIYSPEKINFEEFENVKVSDYVKEMNSAKDAKFDIKIPKNMNLNKKEVALLTLLEMATVEVGKHYRDEKTSDDKMRMLGGVVFSVENTYVERKNDENNLGRVIDKEREALSHVLNEFSNNNKEPMQKFLQEALYHFRIAINPEYGLTEKTKFALKIGSHICNMLEAHPEFLPKEMNPEHMKIYKGVKEVSQFLDEAAQAKMDLGEIDYDNLKSGPEREKLENALSKLMAERLINNEIIKDWKQQDSEIENIKMERMLAIQTEMMKERDRYDKLGPEYNKEKDEKMEAYTQKMNHANSLQFELQQYSKFITNMNPDIKKELLQRIKDTDTIKKAVDFIHNGKNMRERFLLNYESFMTDMTTELEKNSPDIMKNLNIPEKTFKEMTDEGIAM